MQEKILTPVRLTKALRMVLITMRRAFKLISFYFVCGRDHLLISLKIFLNIYG